MVKHFRIWIVWPLALSSLLAANLAKPSAEEILSRYVAALGGQAALEKIISRTLEGVLEIPGMNNSASTSEYFKSPNRFAATTDIPGYGLVRTVYDGKNGWQADPQHGVKELSGPELADISRRADIHWHAKLGQLYPGLKVKGTERINGRDAWKLEASVEGWQYTFYFDAQSALLVRFDTDRHTKDGPSRVSISDYRPVNGVLFAFGSSMSGPGADWRRTLTVVKFNTPIDENVFSKPSATP